MSKKAIPIGSCLSTLLDDSNRMLPFMATILYNLDSRRASGYYMRHLITTLSSGSRAKKVYILCLENSVDRSKFIKRNNIELNDKITLMEEDNIDLSVFDSVTAHIAGSPGGRTDNVLVIDSLLPLLMTSPEDYDKTVHKITIALRRLQSSFAHIIIGHPVDVLHYDKSLECSLKQVSNAVLDFRRESGLDSGVTCPLLDSSIHVHVVVKKKHPRTHLKVSSQHEHFDINDKTLKIIKHHSGPQVRKSIQAKLEPEVKSVPAESNMEKLVPFSLSLKESEQKAKDDLVLPYMRKQESAEKENNKRADGEDGSKSNAGGQVIYHYDKFDDFDEDEDDDPDDDLDF